ncbi:MAG: DUF3106 domain-containing protein [Verrucomicrobia bacterium]|nr:DUF3106 domain-containing protein [Verrucomicrobiota bacterium]
MARFLGPLIILIGGFLFTGYAQTPTPVSSLSSSSPTPQTTRESKLEEFKRSFEQLTSEQQQKFLQNYHRWEDLTPEEREILRQRQRLREKKRDEDTAEALQRSGLHLNEEGRERFRKRYQQERRKLEEQLLKETQERRQLGNAAIIEQLRREFSSAQTR